MKNRTLVIRFGIAALFLAMLACQVGIPSGEKEVIQAEEVRCEKGGYAFMPPPDYEVNVSSQDIGTTQMFPNDIDWEADDYTYEMGPAIQLFGFVPTITFEKYTANVVDQMDAFHQAVVTGQPQVSVAGIPGVAYDFEYEVEGVAGKIKLRSVSVQVSPTHFWEIRFYTTVDKWDKTLADFDAVINTVTFFEPVP